MALDVDVRTDPSRLLAGCRTVIMFADATGTSPDTSPKIAAYAQGRDYHRVLPQRIRRVQRALAALAPDAHFRVCFDIHPLMEHYWAWQAGLGWIGKNSLTITRRAGSRVVLGALLTDLEIPADAPATEHCGTCRACLDACPPQAILAPGLVQAEACISYQTIETQGPLPPDFDAAGWVIGCDICQDVCPWNQARRQKVSRPEEYGRLVAEAAGSGVAGLRTQNEAEFLKKFAGTALMRPGRAVLERNLDHFESRGGESP